MTQLGQNYVTVWCLKVENIMLYSRYFCRMPCLVSISLVNETVETWMMCLAVQDTKLVHALKLKQLITIFYMWWSTAWRRITAFVKAVEIAKQPTFLATFLRWNILSQLSWTKHESPANRNRIFAFSQFPGYSTNSTMAVVCLWVVCVIKTSDSRHENLNLRTLLSFSGGLFNLFDKL